MDNQRQNRITHGKKVDPADWLTCWPVENNVRLEVRTSTPQFCIRPLYLTLVLQYNTADAIDISAERADCK